MTYADEYFDTAFAMVEEGLEPLGTTAHAAVELASYGQTLSGTRDGQACQASWGGTAA